MSDSPLTQSLSAGTFAAASLNSAATSVTSSVNSLTQIPDLKDVCLLLQTIDFTTASLSTSLKDPDKRQEIALKLIDAMLEGHKHGLEFADLKLKTSGGMMTASFKFPVASLVAGLQKIASAAQADEQVAEANDSVTLPDDPAAFTTPTTP